MSSTISFSEALSLVGNTATITVQDPATALVIQNARRLVAAFSPNNIPNYHISFDALIESTESTVSLLASLESDWSTLSNAQFTLAEEDRRIAHELAVEIPSRKGQIADQINALKSRKGAADLATTANSAEYHAWNNRDLATDINLYGWNEYGAGWAGVNVFARNNTTPADNQFPPNADRTNYTTAMLSCNRWMAQWSAQNAKTSFAVNANQSNLLSASAAAEAVAFTAEIARLEKEKAELEARESFLTKEQAIRQGAIDAKILDFGRRAQSLLERGIVYANDAIDSARRLMVAANFTGFDSYLGANTIASLNAVLAQMDPRALPATFTEQLRLIAAIWRSVWGRLMTRENRELFSVRVALTRDVPLSTDVVAAGLRFARVKAFSARIVSDHPGVIILNITRSQMKRREDPTAINDAIYRATLRNVRAIPSGVLPEPQIIRVFDDLPPEGQWELHYSSQNAAPLNCTIDLFVEVSHLT